MKIVGIIPARYASTRLPGKPLIDICGHPMVWWVYQRTCKVEKLDEVYVGTDDDRIYKYCFENKIPVVMTSNKHRTGAHRMQEVSESIMADYYVQINGDEPLVNIEAIEKVIPDDIPQHVEFGSNIITQIDNPTQAIDPSNIKVVYDENMNAIYMSRTPIPYPFDSIDFSYYKHVGILGYNKKMLNFYRDSVPGRFEVIEKIDTLRFMDYGKQLKLIYVPNCHTLSVDTEKDLNEVRKLMRRR